MLEYWGLIVEWRNFVTGKDSIDHCYCSTRPLHHSGLPILCLKKVWKLREVLNVRVTAGPRPAQEQEEPTG